METIGTSLSPELAVVSGGKEIMLMVSFLSGIFIG